MYRKLETYTDKVHEQFCIVYINKEVTKITITVKKMHAQKLMQLIKFCPHLSLPAIEIGTYDLSWLYHKI
jgi:hypothetical protein